jgi:hypothetical protein
MQHGPRSLRGRIWPPRRSIRLRLTVVYFALFVVSAAGLLALTIVLWHAANGTAITTGGSGGQHAPTPPGTTRTPIGVSTQHNADFHHLLVAAAIALVVFAAIAIVLGWVAAARLLRPVRTITTTAKDISATNLHERLNLPGPHDELKELGDTFDDLLSRLERSFQSERQFVANASHELRTPTATMRVWLDVAMAKSDPVPPHITTLAGRLRTELDHVDQLLDSFLALAHTQNGRLTDQATISLSALAAAAVERHADAIGRLDLAVDNEPDDHSWVIGSETLLARMVDNLVDNAVKHNQRGGWVHIVTTHTGNLAGLVVENGGLCLDQSEVSELVRPFRRIGAERTGSERGSGLGLSIVASVVEVHAGTFDLHALPDGGLRVTIALPAAAPAAVKAVR